MKAPLKTMYVTTPFGRWGTRWTFWRHMGVDLRAGVGTEIYAPESGTINERYTGSSGVKVLGLAGTTKWHRFLHLSSYKVTKGQKVRAGQLIGYTGNSGGVAAHLHWDVRKPNTAWSASFSNYYDPMKLINTEEDMYLNKTAKEWYEMYDNRGKKIVELQRKVADLEKQVKHWFNKSRTSPHIESVLKRFYHGVAPTKAQIIRAADFTPDEQSKRIQASTNYTNAIQKIKEGGSVKEHLPEKIRAIYKD